MTESVRNRTTPEGAAIGKNTARLCDAAEPLARLKLPELPPRCNSCACREGPHVANGSPVTQMDFLKCIMEGHEFLCHDRRGKGRFAPAGRSSCSQNRMRALSRCRGIFPLILKLRRIAQHEQSPRQHRCVPHHLRDVDGPVFCAGIEGQLLPGQTFPLGAARG
jgi:hypothetical protein